MGVQLDGLGKFVVPTPGTPVPVVIPAASVLQPFTSCHALLAEALSSNTGKIYIGRVGMNKTTLVGVLIVLPVPSTNVLPTFSIAVQQGANAISIGSFYVDADNSNEGVSVSVMVV